MWTFCAGCDIIIKIQIYMLKSGTPNTIGTSNKVNEVCYMTVSYKKLWKLLIDRDLKKKDLEEIFSYRVRTPNAILIRNDKQSGNDRSTEEKRTISIACSCQNGYVRKSEPKLIGT